MNDINQSQALLSPPDKRDFTISSAMEVCGTPMPQDFEVWQPPVEDQGRTGNCVAQALANIMECIEHRRLGYNREYSVGYIYGTELSTAPGSGMYPREACKSLVKEGDIYRMFWECFDENPTCRMKRMIVADYIKSQAKKVGSYVRLETLDEVKAFIYKYNLPVLITAESKYYAGGEGSAGYHATVCYGWESEESFYKTHPKSEPYKDLKYTNSWGEKILFNPTFKPQANISFYETSEIWGIIPMEPNKLIDVQQHWAKKDIEEAAELGLIRGYEDNTFKPDRPITRAEVTTIAMRLFRNLQASDENLSARIQKLEKMFGINTGN